MQLSRFQYAIAILGSAGLAVYWASAGDVYGTVTSAGVAAVFYYLALSKGKPRA